MSVYTHPVGPCAVTLRDDATEPIQVEIATELSWLSVAEARQLALDLIDAVIAVAEQSGRGGARTHSGGGA